MPTVLDTQRPQSYVSARAEESSAGWSLPDPTFSWWDIRGILRVIESDFSFDPDLVTRPRGEPVVGHNPIAIG